MGILVKNQSIGSGQRPYIVAEISGNHGGSKDNAIKLISAAKWAGADAVKFQCYEPDSLTIEAPQDDFTLSDGPWAGQTLHELYERNHTPFDWFPELFEFAEHAGITAFASVFCERGLQLLEGLKCPAYKIASMEIGHLDLIRAVVATGKPVIVSTGMASAAEIQSAYALIKNNGLLLHCVSGYPTPTEDARLGMLKSIKSFAPDVGISDHSHGLVIPVAATALGACLIERHLEMLGVEGDDTLFSSNERDFLEMVNAVYSTWSSLQSVGSGVEDSSRALRRSLYVVADMKAGDITSATNVAAIRPGFGYPPNKIADILGKRAKQDIARGTRAHPDLFA